MDREAYLFIIAYRMMAGSLYIKFKQNRQVVKIMLNLSDNYDIMLILY